MRELIRAQIQIGIAQLNTCCIPHGYACSTRLDNLSESRGQIHFWVSLLALSANPELGFRLAQIPYRLD
jgi:hypothetical protein